MLLELFTIPHNEEGLALLVVRKYNKLLLESELSVVRRTWERYHVTYIRHTGYKE